MARKFELFDWILVLAITCFLVAFTGIVTVGFIALRAAGLI